MACCVVDKVAVYLNGEQNPSGSFTSGGGNLLVTFCGSGWINDSGDGGPIGIMFWLNGIQIGSSVIFANANSFHLAFVPHTVFTAPFLEGETVNWAVTKMPGTTLDQNDVISVSILEIKS